MKKALLLVVFLGIVSAVSGLCVGYVNSITAPIIEERLIAAEKETLEMMFPNAEFEAIKEDNEYVTSIYRVAQGGYAVKFETKGYNGSTPIICLVGFDQDGTIFDLIVLQQQETDGFGTRVFEDANIDTLYVGKTLDQGVDLLSGATVTSSAMQRALTSVQEFIKGLN